MYVSLNVGKTGMKAMQNKMDAVADELANANTYGYKKKEVRFQELLNNEIYDNEVILSDNVNNGVINQGSRSGVGTVNFKQGGLIQSSGPFHLALEGDGFFGVRNEYGQLLLTRNGGFHIDANNNVSDDDGYPLDMQVYVPREQWGNEKISISTSGEITTMDGDETILLGRIILYNPGVLDSLTILGEGRYLPSDNVPLYNSINNPGMFGSMNQHMLESSNVDVVKSLSDMIVTQNAYNLNARAVQTTDEILTMINGIKR